MLPGDAQGAAHPGLQQWRAATVLAACTPTCWLTN